MKEHASKWLPVAVQAPYVHIYGTCTWVEISAMYVLYDSLCGLVVRVSGYRYRGLGFDSRRYQIF